MRLKVKVIAGAKSESISSEGGKEDLKVKLSAHREKGKANERLIEMLAEHFHVSKSKVEILRGHVSSRKEVEIHDDL